MSCQTKENNLRMDCLFEPDPTGGQVTCDYLNGNSLAGSTNSSAKPEPAYTRRATVNITNKVCRLDLTGFSSDKPQNFTCIIKQRLSAMKTSIVDKSKDDDHELDLFCGSTCIYRGIKHGNLKRMQEQISSCYTCMNLFDLIDEMRSLCASMNTFAHVPRS